MQLHSVNRRPNLSSRCLRWRCPCGEAQQWFCLHCNFGLCSAEPRSAAWALSRELHLAGRQAVAGKLAELLKYYEHLAMFLVQYAGTVRSVCFSHSVWMRVV